MIRILLFLLPLAVLLSSCQKEFSADLTSRTDSTDTTGNSLTGPLLVKMVDSAGSYEYVTELEYDSKNRLIRQKESTNDPNYFATDLQIFRNAQGIITKTTKLTTSVNWGTDFAEMTYYYNSTTLGRYTHARAGTAVGSGDKDSTAFRYDANGRIEEQEFYLMDAGSTTYEPIGKSTYTYDIAGNVLDHTDSTRSAGQAYRWGGSYTYEYDLTRKYPLYLGVEGILLYTGAAKNLPLTFRLDHTDNQYDMLVTFDSYIFNSDNLPVSFTTMNSLSGLTKSMYYYRP